MDSKNWHKPGRSGPVRVGRGLALAGGVLAASASLAQAQSVPANGNSEIEILRQELEAQKAVTQSLEQKIDALSTAQSQAAQQAATVGPAATLTAGYDHGFYIKDATGDNALHINGLLQPRYTFFSTHGTNKFGGTDQDSSNFDVYLGRLYFSGNIADPSVKFWVTLQGTTTGNGSSLTLLDAEVSKTFSPTLTVEMGRYWSAYTYEYNDDIAKYLFPDLSAAEYAFSLGRQVGIRLSGKTGDLTYRLAVGNTIPGGDVAELQNQHGQVAVVGNLEYDILAPYGYQESDPNPEGAKTPELTLWASGFYNPVAYDSVFENELAGDKTHGATASLNFRTGYFTFQGSGYYKNNENHGDGHGGFDSYGWQEQAGYYLIPGKLELAQRVDGTKWGRGEIPTTGGAENNWWAGPGNFSYKDLIEYTFGLNYYLHGHSVKAQLEYSYLAGSGFNDQDFNANRVLLQTQVAF